MLTFDAERVETPAYVIDLGALRRNVTRLAEVQEQAGCKILLALKGFATWGVFPTLSDALAGVAASSPHEAELGREKFGGEVHSYSPAYSDADLRQLAPLSDHMVFNSATQYRRFCELDLARNGFPRCGYRINPEHSEVEHAIYDPCARRSRLGMTLRALEKAEMTGITGLHFHTLCQNGPDALGRTLRAIEERFPRHLEEVSWVNFGGGHHITRPDYDVVELVRLVRDFRARWQVDVYLEPGEAVALNTGVLVASVLDVVENDVRIALLDTSASAHMPDVLEMPYRPSIVGAAAAGELPHTYRLGGNTCLAGDVIGDYSFDKPLEVGDRLVFEDMAHYTMVKNTTFNGVRLPSIATFEPETGEYRVLRRFEYADYRDRLS